MENIVKNKNIITKVEGIIFDLDGTLLDSVAIWDLVIAQYFQSKGILLNKDIKNELLNFTFEEAIIFLIKKYEINESLEDVFFKLNYAAAQKYEDEITLKEGALSILNKIKEKNIPMCVATASTKSHAISALKRNGILEYFKAIITCNEAGENKNSPTIFNLARKELNSGLDNTWVFEDSLHAIKTAKAAGYKVLGIYDLSSKSQIIEIENLVDIYIYEWNELDIL